MKFEDAKNLVGLHRKIENYSPKVFYVITEYLYKDSSRVNIVFFNKEGEAYISDYGGAYEYSTMERKGPKLEIPEGEELEELKNIAYKYGFKFDGASFVKKFERIEDVDTLLELIGEVAGEESEE